MDGEVFRRRPDGGQGEAARPGGKRPVRQRAAVLNPDSKIQARSGARKIVQAEREGEVRGREKAGTIGTSWPRRYLTCQKSS